jgi:hypothetical protein
MRFIRVGYIILPERDELVFALIILIPDCHNQVTISHQPSSSHCTIFLHESMGGTHSRHGEAFRSLEYASH